MAQQQLDQLFWQAFVRIVRIWPQDPEHNDQWMSQDDHRKRLQAQADLLRLAQHDASSQQFTDDERGETNVAMAINRL